MVASLVPDTADLSVLACICVVAALAIGVGVWTGARRAETALLAGWGVASFATVVIGTQTTMGLSYVMTFLALAGVAGLARIAVAEARGSRLLAWEMAAKVCVLAVPLVMCVASVRTIGWDDFSHWLPNLAYISLYDHFPSLAQPGSSAHAGYPYALALPGFAVFLLLGRIADDAAVFWNVVIMLAAGTSIATVLAHRLTSGVPDPREARGWAWFSAAIGLLLAGLAGPSFVPKIFFSNMADYATGAVLTVIALMLFDWVGAAPTGVPRQEPRWRAACVVACGCAVLIDLRQANEGLFGLLVLSCCVAGWRNRERLDKGTLLSLAIVVLPPLVILRLWSHYVATQIPGGEFPILPFSQWRWAIFPTTLYNIARIMIAKAGLFLVIFAVGIRALLALRANDTLDPRNRHVVITSAMVCVGAICFLAATYLAVGFDPREAAAAESFWRYMGELGPLAVVGVVAGIPLAWPRRLPWRPATRLLIGIAILLPLVTVTFYRADLTSAVPLLRREAADVDRLVPRGAPILLADMTGNGFAERVMFYELALSGRDRGAPPRPVTNLTSVAGISAERARTVDFAASAYIWLAEGAPEMSALFGPRLSAACGYLLKREANGFSIVTRWPLAPYRWLVIDNIGWSTNDTSPCD